MDRTEDSKRHASSSHEKREDQRAKPVGRRAALARLGLAVGVGYLAPTLALLKGARADDNGGGNGYNPPWQHNSKPSKSKPGHGHGGD